MVKTPRQAAPRCPTATLRPDSRQRAGYRPGSDVEFPGDQDQRDDQQGNTIAVTRYQFRLSVYRATVVIAALVAASPRLISWAVRGRPPEYVYVELDGKPVLFDARVWPTHPLNPANRAAPADIDGP
jgi:hypothetical protein